MKEDGRFVRSLNEGPSFFSKILGLKRRPEPMMEEAVIDDLQHERLKKEENIVFWQSHAVRNFLSVPQL